MDLIGPYEQRKFCSLCRSPAIESVLSMASTPLANEFVPAQYADVVQQVFPLSLALCFNCGHLQIEQLVDPSRLFSNYVYETSTSPLTVQHIRNQAADMARKGLLDRNWLCVEIGSNDGAMLLELRTQYGMRILGVDPAETIVTRANEKGITTMKAFFSTTIAKEIVATLGLVDLVVANNVFAHASDLLDIALGVKSMLGLNGTFVFEVAHLLDFAETSVWDTIYHEHFSYHTVMPLDRMFRSIGMHIADVERTRGQIGRGSLRVYVRHGDKAEVPMTVAALMGDEASAGLFEPKFYVKLKKKIERQKDIALTHLDFMSKSYLMAGYGAPAKLTTLMYQFGLSREHSAYVVDDSPWKQGLLTPGRHIPIFSPELLETETPGVLVIYAWNFASDIMRRYAKVAAQKGMRFVIPMPHYQEIESGRND